MNSSGSLRIGNFKPLWDIDIRVQLSGFAETRHRVFRIARICSAMQPNGFWMDDGYQKHGYGELKRRIDAGKAPIDWPKKVFSRVVRGGIASRFVTGLDELRRPTRAKPVVACERMHREIGFWIVRPLDAPSNVDAAKYWDADVEQIRAALKDRLQLTPDQLGIVDPNLPNAIRRTKTK